MKSSFSIDTRLWIALNRSKQSEKACFRRQNRIRCGVDQYFTVVWTWNALLSMLKQSSADSRWQWISLFVWLKKSNKTWVMEGKPQCICLKDCNQSRGDKQLGMQYTYSCLKQPKFVSKVQSQPKRFSTSKQFPNQKGNQRLKAGPTL